MLNSECRNDETQSNTMDSFMVVLLLEFKCLQFSNKAVMSARVYIIASQCRMYTM